MNTEDQLAARLYELISRKEYSALKEEEKKIVLENFSEQEYKDFCKIISSGTPYLLKEFKEHYFQKQEIKESLQNAFRKKHKKEPIVFLEYFSALLNYKIPVYQTAFGMIALSLTMYWHFSKQNLSEVINEVLVTTVDTVYIHEKAVVNNYERDTAMLITGQPKKVMDKIRVDRKANFDETENRKEQFFYEPPNGINTTNYTPQQISGSSLKDDTVFSEFVVKVI